MSAMRILPRGYVVPARPHLTPPDEGLPLMSEAELISAKGGLPGLFDVREMRQRAVVTAILEAEMKLLERTGGGR
jgi:hypothetical protein